MTRKPRMIIGKCLECGTSLMSKEVVFNGYEAIKAKIEFQEDNSGNFVKNIVYIDPRWGVYSKEYVNKDLIPKKGDIVRFFCPYCGKEFVNKDVCSECGAHVVGLRDAVTGNIVEICTRCGCSWHTITDGQAPLVAW